VGSGYNSIYFFFGKGSKNVKKLASWAQQRGIKQKNKIKINLKKNNNNNTGLGKQNKTKHNKQII
jgi:hypothetical protein